MAVWLLFRRTLADCYRFIGLHVGPEDGIDASLVSGPAAKPEQQVGVEMHGHDSFGAGMTSFAVFQNLASIACAAGPAAMFLLISAGVAQRRRVQSVAGLLRGVLDGPFDFIFSNRRG